MTGAGLLLHGGTVFDGLGAPGRVADVAAVDGRVVAVGDDPPAGLRRIGVFDPATVGHDATYLDPDVPVRGIGHVVFAGDLVVEHGQFSGRRSGRVLRRAGGSTAAPR
jgi:N-acyl-D-amino-acid deacylase